MSYQRKTKDRWDIMTNWGYGWECENSEYTRADAKEIKTLKEWEESGKNWDDFCKPGELVDEDVYWYFLNILPPRNMGAGYLQVGGPYDSRLNPKTGKYMATYSTFVKVGDKVWKYCGNCFPGESVDIESEDKR